ncbi:hypothetical protein WJX72_002442 [[Myrmecia] bisecta]|uniref:Fluoride ion transporter CrcB n=1 Tax=[Myrmecia] bisecta TaxID=41462 RepID=A0AAW1R607_9CHLO
MKHTATVVVHLCLGSQLGVLTRIYLSQLFQNGCSGHWGVCLTSPGTSSTHYSAYFTDLPANLLGCFVMGLLASMPGLTPELGSMLTLRSSTPLGNTDSSLEPKQDDGQDSSSSESNSRARNASQLNNALPGRWGWLPLGTFIANMLACAVDYIIKAVLVRTGTQSYWAQLLTSAVITGFAGSLSTVSTWAMEIQAHLKAVPESIHGYVYAIGTIITGALLGVILYGWSMWA